MDRPRDPYLVRSVDELRELLGTPTPGLDLKNQAALDEFAIEFIARSPFLVLSTADAAGHLDASPKGDQAGFVLVEDHPETRALLHSLGDARLHVHDVVPEQRLTLELGEGEQAGVPKYLAAGSAENQRAAPNHVQYRWDRDRNEHGCRARSAQDELVRRPGVESGQVAWW